MAETERLADPPVDSQEAFSALPLLDAAIRYLALGVAGNRDPEADSMAERIGAEIQPSATRDIIILSGPLDDAVERAMLSWATLAGTAVVLEPSPGHRIATAAWVRTTVFHGTPEEVAGLREWVEKEGKGRWRRGRRLPFGRLRTVLVAGPQELPQNDEAFWRKRGVNIGRVPAD